MISPETTLPPRGLARHASLCLLALLAAAACGEPTGSGKEEEKPIVTGFIVLSGPARSDTVRAAMGSPMVVELRDPRGAPLAGVTVAARVLKASGPGGMILQNAIAYVDSVSEVTDSRGQFRLSVTYGPVAGPSGIVLSARAASLTDTVEFNLLPGAAYRIRASPSDTAVILNRGVALRATVFDRQGNPRPERPTFTGGAGIGVQAGGEVTGLAYGRSMVYVAYGTLRDSVAVAVVPAGRIAGIQGDFYLFTMNADGSDYRAALASLSWAGGPARWAPDGRSVLVSAGSQWTGPFSLGEVAVSDGPLRPVLPQPRAGSQTWPAYSRDGSWIYFVDVPGPNERAERGGAIWRVRRDGSGAEEVVAASGSAAWKSPSPSPAGDRLAYVGSDGRVVVRTLATGAATAVGGTGVESVEWSPTGDRLLTCGSAGLAIVGADGGGARALRPAASGQVCMGTSWSPDAKWVIWKGNGAEMIQLDPELVVPNPVLSERRGFSWMAGS